MCNGILLAIFIFLGTGSPAWAEPAPVDLARYERAVEALIYHHINVERAKFAPATPMLTPDPDLTDIARKRSDAMAHGAPFAHENKKGEFVAADLVRTRFGPYGTIGENIMKMQSPRMISADAFARRAVSGWMKSPGHRKNILSPAYNASGIGVAVRGTSAYATQVFRGAP